MSKNSFSRLSSSRGFTLIEMQLYLAFALCIILMLTQIALTYRTLYDKVAVNAQRSVLLVAAIRHVNEQFDEAMQQRVGQKNGEKARFVAAFLKKNKLVTGNGHTVVLDNVDAFTFHTDNEKDTLMGSSFSCTYGGRTISWYHISPLKAFACSYPLFLS